MSFRVKTTYKDPKKSNTEKNTLKSSDVDSGVSSISALLYGGETETKEIKRNTTQGLRIKSCVDSEDYY